MSIGDLYVLVSGKRDYDDYEHFSAIMDDYVAKYGKFIIVEGGAKGADALAKRYAIEHKMNFIEFPADWKKHGNAAGPIRNAQMVEFIKDRNSMAVFFWDGRSRGTKNCLSYARLMKIKCDVVHI